MTEPVAISVDRLNTGFPIKLDGKRSFLRVVRNVSFEISRGEVLGLVGESGCGKTTVGRSMLGLAKPQSGQIRLGDVDLAEAGRRELRKMQLRLRMVFQDPYASLNPRRTIGDSIAEAGDIHKLFPTPMARRDAIANTLTEVGLNPDFASRFPHELSGGQRQRVGIGRAILPRPDTLIADEAVSALDVSIQAQVLNLLADLKDRLGIAMLFISHDLGVVAQISDRVAVMYMGEIVEIGAVGSVLSDAIHPYTKMLVAARPVIDPRLRIKGGLELGEPSSRMGAETGCSFADRCAIATPTCRVSAPALRELKGRRVACHNV